MDQGGNKWKTTFIAGRKTYESTVMFFGQTNAPAIFQTMMNNILSDLEACVIVYIDDIVIFTRPEISEEEHDRIVKTVLDRLKKHDLFLKPKKCFFKQKEIEFLRVWVSKNEIRIDSEKVWAVQEWPCPTRVKQVQCFLGLANYYR